MAREYRTHTVDEKQMTTDEIAAMLGLTKAALYNHKSKLGGVSMQCVVTMFRSNMIGNDRCKRYLIDGQWMTTGQIAGMLGIKTHSLVAWRNRRKRPDGTPAPMDEAIEYFRGYQTGDRKRHHNLDGRKPDRFRVGRSIVTVPGLAAKYKVRPQSIYRMKNKFGGDMARVVEHYEARKRRRMEKAELEIMKILMGG